MNLFWVSHSSYVLRSRHPVSSLRTFSDNACVRRLNPHAFVAPEAAPPEERGLNQLSGSGLVQNHAFAPQPEPEPEMRGEPLGEPFDVGQGLEAAAATPSDIAARRWRRAGMMARIAVGRKVLLSGPQGGSDLH